MLTREVQIRVNYFDTDGMGVVHHSNYARFYEIARTELLRQFGTSYKEMENSGVMLPVLEVYTRCLSPAYYDDVLTIKITMPELPKVKLRFEHEVYREDGALINTGYVVLAFTDCETRKPCRAPESFLSIFRGFFNG